MADQHDRRRGCRRSGPPRPPARRSAAHPAPARRPAEPEPAARRRSAPATLAGWAKMVVTDHKPRGSGGPRSPISPPPRTRSGTVPPRPMSGRHPDAGFHRRPRPRAIIRIEADRDESRNRPPGRSPVSARRHAARPERRAAERPAGLIGEDEHAGTATEGLPEWQSAFGFLAVKISHECQPVRQAALDQVTFGAPPALVQRPEEGEQCHDQASWPALRLPQDPVRAGGSGGS